MAAKRKLTEQQRRGGFYWDGDKPYISVTTILGILDKPALRYWFGREVYRAMIVDPTLSEKDALKAPYRSSKKAMHRGTTIHKMVETYKHTQEHIKRIPKAFKGYADAFYTWVEDTNMVIRDHEKRVISKKHGYAGTLDLMIEYPKSGRLCIIDVKTGKAVYDEVFLQLSAYKQALHEREGIEADMAVLLLETGKDNEPTGNYKFVNGTYHFDEFLAAQKLWIWKNRELIARLKEHVRAKKKGGDSA